jgi:hypothetical protein
MPSDTELILSALSEKPRRRETKRVVLQEFDDYGVSEMREEPKKDALTRLGKKIKRQANREKRKLRPVMEWNNTDFLVFAQDKLKAYSIFLENNGGAGAEMIGRLYDRLAAILQDDMNNKVLKDYLDWWIVSFASSIKSHSVFIQAMYDEKYVGRFAKRYNEQGAEIKTAETVARSAEQDDETIYKTGSLSMLLMSKGIVSAHAFLKKQKETNIIMRIGKALRAFSPSVLRSTMETTINKAPYPSADRVDFISIARPALELHGLKTYLNLDYSKYFKETRD